jgi:hypothetical protein
MIKNIFKYLSIIILLLMTVSGKDPDLAFYGGIKPEDYLTGRFDPARCGVFVPVAANGIPAKDDSQLLRRDVAAALKKMYDDFHTEYPRIRLFVYSAARNFNVQKSICEDKWEGRRLADGKNLNRTIKDPLKRALAILRYSSMPGTSRHHWGTDFDVNSVSEEYYKSGEGKIIYEWLKSNAGKYGFCQPYTAGRKGGYEEEKWHWSYYPVAEILLKEWNKLYNSGVIKINKKGNFKGSAEAGHLSPDYVNGINASCK